MTLSMKRLTSFMSTLFSRQQLMLINFHLRIEERLSCCHAAFLQCKFLRVPLRLNHYLLCSCCAFGTSLFAFPINLFFYFALVIVTNIRTSYIRSILFLFLFNLCIKLVKAVPLQGRLNLFLIFSFPKKTGARNEV